MSSPLLYQVLVLILAFISILFLTIRYRKKQLATLTFLISIILWLIIIAIGILPQQTTIVARFFGLKRGLDLIFALSIAFLAYILIRLNLKLDRQNEQLTKLIRKIAIDNEESIGDNEYTNDDSVDDEN